MTDFCCRCRRLKPNAGCDASCLRLCLCRCRRRRRRLFCIFHARKQQTSGDLEQFTASPNPRTAPRLAVVAPLAAFYLFIYLWVLLPLPLCNVCKRQENEKVWQVARGMRGMRGTRNNRRTCHSKPSTSNHQKAFNNTAPQLSIHLSLVNVAVVRLMLPLPLLLLLLMLLLLRRLLRHQRKCYVQCSFGHFDFGAFPKRQREKIYRDDPPSNKWFFPITITTFLARTEIRFALVSAAKNSHNMNGVKWS